jgi:hypothetical protein
MMMMMMMMMEQVPMHVTTKLASIRRPTMFAPTPDAYAKSGLRWIGYEPVCSPYWAHSMMWGLAAAFPAPLVDALRLRQSLAVRKRGKAKDARRKDDPSSSSSSSSSARIVGNSSALLAHQQP